MRVTFISNKLNKTGGGSNFSLELMARSLCSRDHDIRIVTLNLTSPNDLPAEYPYEVIERPIGKKELLRPSRVSSVFSEFEDQSDIFHVFSPLIAPYAGYYRQNGGTTPVFCRLNQYRSLCSDVSKMDGECHKQCGMADRFRHSKENVPNRLVRTPFYYLQSRKYTKWMNAADTHYAISPAIKDVFDEFGVREELIEVIPNFYDPEFGTEESSPHEEECSDVLYVGRLSGEKGVDLLIQAFETVPSEVSLHIVGDGPEKESLEQQTAQLGLRDQITFHGYVDHADLSEYYRTADLFVHPGRWPEPFGRTILEAWQMDCAVLVSNIGGPAWSVQDAGLLFDRNDVDGLAEQLNRCVENGALLAEMRQKGRDRLEDFKPDTVLDTVETRMQAISSSGN